MACVTSATYNLASCQRTWTAGPVAERFCINLQPDVRSNCTAVSAVGKKRMLNQEDEASNDDDMT